MYSLDNNINMVIMAGKNITNLGMKVVTTQPIKPDRTVMRNRAETAARNTVSLLFLMARMAAMKNVLSPISDTRMTVMDSPVGQRF